MLKYLTKIIDKSMSKRPRFTYQQYPVELYQVGQRLDRHLTQKAKIGWKQIQILLRNKDITIKNNKGQRTNKNSYILQEGDSILINERLKNIFSHVEKYQNIQYQTAKNIIDDMIIFDNQNITILNKHNGFTVQGGKQYQKNLFSLMVARYQKQFVYIAHRLDKSTSGILMFSKNLQTAKLIQGQIQKKINFHKYYLAITQGPKINKSHGYIQSDIQWTNKHMAKIIPQQKQQSKNCITYYTVLNNNLNSNQNIIGIKLITGRKHQIRCHLAQYLNNSIRNDIKYGANKVQGINEDCIFLHAFHTAIDNQEILQRVFLNKGITQKTQTKSGKIQFLNGKVLITAKIPQFWNKQALNLDEIIHKISQLQIRDRSKFRQADKTIKII